MFPNFSQLNEWLVNSMSASSRELIQTSFSKIASLMAQVRNLGQNFASVYQSVQKYVYSDDEYVDLTTEELASVPRGQISMVQQSVNDLTNYLQNQKTGLSLQGEPHLNPALKIGNALVPSGSEPPTGLPFPNIRVSGSSASGSGLSGIVNYIHGVYPVAGRRVNWAMQAKFVSFSTGSSAAPGSRCEYIRVFILTEVACWMREWKNPSTGVQSSTTLGENDFSPWTLVDDSQFPSGPANELDLHYTFSAGGIGTSVKAEYATYQPEIVVQSSQDLNEILLDRYKEDIDSLSAILEKL